MVQTSHAERTEEDMETLLFSYEYKKGNSLTDIIAFHVNFENIHPFADGNGRVGRLIMYKECLRNNTCPLSFKMTNKLTTKKPLIPIGLARLMT
nr:Fic family protein [Aerococcus urinaehominis]